MGATHLSDVPGRPRVVQNPSRDGAHGTPTRVDYAYLPIPTLHQRRNRMPEVDLMRPARQAMEHHKHGPLVLAPKLPELRVLEELRPRGKRRIAILKRLVYKVDRVGPLAGPVVRLEHLALVVDGRAVLLYGGPHGLHVAVEEQRVQVAGGRRLPGHGGEVGFRSILALEGEGGGGVREGDVGAAEPVHG